VSGTLIFLLHVTMNGTCATVSSSAVITTLAPHHTT
jgi:hypothetical protein